MRASLALIAALLVAACGPGATPVPSPTAVLYTLTGTMVLSDEKFPGTPGSCSGFGGYDDISAGTDVVVRDGAGTILAKGGLAPGKLDNDHNCTFPFAVSGIPEVAFYSVEVAHRGALTYSFAEMVSQGWTVGFTLGS